MLNSGALLAAAGLAGIAAALVLVAATAVRRPAVGGVLAGAAGVALGCWWLGLWPAWPPREDAGRLVLFLLPAAAAVELAAAVNRMALRRANPLRVIVALLAARILLHDSVYLVGPESGEWSTTQAVAV